MAEDDVGDSDELLAEMDRVMGDFDQKMAGFGDTDNAGAGESEDEILVMTKKNSRSVASGEDDSQDAGNDDLTDANSDLVDALLDDRSEPGIRVRPGEASGGLEGPSDAHDNDPFSNTSLASDGRDMDDLDVEKEAESYGEAKEGAVDLPENDENKNTQDESWDAIDEDAVIVVPEERTNTHIADTIDEGGNATPDEDSQQLSTGDPEKHTATESEYEDDAVVDEGNGVGYEDEDENEIDADEHDGHIPEEQAAKALADEFTAAMTAEAKRGEYIEEEVLVLPSKLSGIRESKEGDVGARPAKSSPSSPLVYASRKFIVTSRKASPTNTSPGSPKRDFNNSKPVENPYQNPLTKPVYKAGNTQIGLSEAKLFGLVDVKGKIQLSPSNKRERSASKTKTHQLAQPRVIDPDLLTPIDDGEDRKRAQLKKKAERAMRNPRLAYDFLDKLNENGDFLDRVGKPNAKQKKKQLESMKQDYDARLDKLMCPKCKRFQSFDEFNEKKRKCTLCAVKFEKSSVCNTNTFLKRMNANIALREVKLAELDHEVYKDVPRGGAKAGEPTAGEVALATAKLAGYGSVSEVRSARRPKSASATSTTGAKSSELYLPSAAKPLTATPRQSILQAAKSVPIDGSRRKSLTPSTVPVAPNLSTERRASLRNVQVGTAPALSGVESKTEWVAPDNITASSSRASLTINPQTQKRESKSEFSKTVPRAPSFSTSKRNSLRNVHTNGDGKGDREEGARGVGGGGPSAAQGNGSKDTREREHVEHSTPAQVTAYKDLISAQSKRNQEINEMVSKAEAMYGSSESKRSSSTTPKPAVTRKMSKRASLKKGNSAAEKFNALLVDPGEGS